MRAEAWGAGLALLCGVVLGCKRADEVDCRRLGAAIQSRLTAIADQHGSCKTDADCTLAVITLPCDPETPRQTSLARSQAAAFGKDVDALAQELCGELQAACNSFCGAKVGGTIQRASPRCRLGDCDADASPSGGVRHFSSVELCRSKAHSLIE